MIEVSVKENSWVAAVAARVLKAKRMAIVINHTVHLHKASYEEFMNNQCWLLHELKHVSQYRQHGTAGFIRKYLYESMKKGYWDNLYEVEARAAEKDATELTKYTVRKNALQ